MAENTGSLEDSIPHDWEALNLVKKDICFLYHELSEYRYFMPDLNFGRLYTLPYWNFLGVLDIWPEDGSVWSFWPEEGHAWPGEDLLFIKQGCLMLILAMSLDVIEGSGDCLSPHLTEVCAIVESCAPDDERTEKLLRAVKLALQLIRTGSPGTDELFGLACWAHQEFVVGYFRSIAREFGGGP